VVADEVSSVEVAPRGGWKPQLHDDEKRKSGECYDERQNPVDTSRGVFSFAAMVFACRFTPFVLGHAGDFPKHRPRANHRGGTNHRLASNRVDCHDGTWRQDRTVQGHRLPRA
jgi:hypothetical protein